MEIPRLKEEKIIKDNRNLFRIKKEVKGSKYIVLRRIKNIFQYKKKEENYYKPVKVDNFWKNSYIEYKSNGDQNKIISVE